jgi:DNA-binding GntR family transcriptional regulator
MTDVRAPAPPGDSGIGLTRREAALRRLRDEIISGYLPGGSQIKDAETAARLQISITPVREAIGQLEAEGLVQQAPNRTRRVALITRRAALEMHDVMTVLARTGFEWGVPHLTADDLAAMRAAYDHFIGAVRDGRHADAGKAGTAFSAVVITAGGNRELQRHVHLVVGRLLRVMAFADPGRWEIWTEGYREILERLEAGDGPGALARHDDLYRQYRDHIEALPFPDDEPI